jgi:hypothetical protein
MMRRTIQLGLLGLLLLSAKPAEPCDDAGRYGEQCPPYQVCSVYTGDCFSGKAPLCVCTGFCRGGLIWRFIPKAGMFLANEGDSFGGAFGLEIVPPVLGGYLSVHGEWMTEDLWRFGLVATLPVFYSMLIGISADGVHAHGDWAAGGSLRLEVFPHLITRGTVFSHTSILFEGGAQVFGDLDDDWYLFGIMGLRIWL